MTHQDGDEALWSYDEATGLLLSKTYPDWHQELYGYDTMNRLISKTQARQVNDSGTPLITTYVYDELSDRLLQVNHNDGTAFTQYFYDKIINLQGALIRVNPFRHSCEYADDETGLIYYNYRYYSTQDGHWINRDPIDEQGGLNLYGYVGNRVSWLWDMLGLELKQHSIKEHEVQIVPKLQNGEGGLVTRTFDARVTTANKFFDWGKVQIFVTGDLKMNIKVVKNKSTKNEFVKKAIAHEIHHANINIKYWNILVKEINYIENKWCKPCYQLAMNYGNVAIKLRSLQAQVENLEFDVNNYKRLNVRQKRQ